MTGKTHRVGGMLSALAGFTILESKGLMISGVNPLLQLTIMYPFAIYGSVFSDLDHNPNSIPSKDLVSVAVNRLLHLSEATKGPLSVFNARHRSWQTHSDLFLFVVIALFSALMSNNSGTANGIILQLVGMGFLLGVISHLILDMLTPEGIWCFGLVLLGKATKSDKTKIRLVPKSHFFSTGGNWEDFVRAFMWFICILLLIRVIYVMQPYRINFNF